jgi:mono/diheme cytochrome c family protein
MLVLVGGLIWYFSGSFEKKVDYITEVKPIFNKKCIACHGGVKAKANFSLLFREDALKPAKSGKFPIVPGKPGQSEMIRRITEKDE